MKHLWSPWRLEYLMASKSDGCIFCHAALSDGDRENLVLFRGERAFLILNRYPYNNGHFMIVPYTHVPSLEDLNEPTLSEMMQVVNLSLAVLRQAYAPHGFNVGVNLGQAAGAGIAEHVHMHVVPRWTADTNFMPVVGSTRVIPELLDDAYARLRPIFASLDDG